MGVCGSKSVDSASDSSDSDSEEPSRKPSHQHGVTVAKSEVCRVHSSQHAAYLEFHAKHCFDTTNPFQLASTKTQRLHCLVQPSGRDVATLDQVKIDMSGPKAGRQRMAIAAEGASANAHVEIVKATKSPAVIDLLGELIMTGAILHLDHASSGKPAMACRLH